MRALRADRAAAPSRWSVDTHWPRAARFRCHRKRHPGLPPGCTSAAATNIRRSSDEIVVESSCGAFSTSALINCAGLFNDRIARMAGDAPGVMIVPFRGEYYDLVPERSALVRALIYPVPDPHFPFLECTSPAASRVESTPAPTPSLPSHVKATSHRHQPARPRRIDRLPRLLAHGPPALRNGIDEWHRSLSKPAFVKALQRLLPEIAAPDLVPGDSGVRAQGLKPDGALVDDFQLVPSGKVPHGLNVPSPAATASLTIAKTIVDLAANNLGLR